MQHKSELDFKADVLEASYHQPVVVDFWAAWCGPCRVLGPVIEQIAREQSARWTLVKVDTEAFPEVAEAYHIQSIPNVKMFYQGEVIAEFAGAYPRHAILEWLDVHLPDPRKAVIAELLQQLPASKAQVRELIDAHPELLEPRVALAKHLVFIEPQEAETLVQDILLGDKWYEAASDIRVLAQLMQSDFSQDTPVAQALAQAQQALRRDASSAEGIQQIIQAVLADKHFQQDLPRRAAIALFRLWGDAHPLTQAYRRQFDMALY